MYPLSLFLFTVYEAGNSNAIKTATVAAPNTRFSDNVYYPGKAYEFYIYARLVPSSAQWAHMFQIHAEIESRHGMQQPLLQPAAGCGRACDLMTCIPAIQVCPLMPLCCVCGRAGTLTWVLAATEWACAASLSWHLPRRCLCRSMRL